MTQTRRAVITGLAPGTSYEVDIAYEKDGILGKWQSLGPVTPGNLVADNSNALGGTGASTVLGNIASLIAADITFASDLIAEQVARAAADGTLQTYITSMEVFGDGALNQNPIFRNWPTSGNLPTGWSDSQTGGTRTRVAGLTALSPYAIQLVTSGGVNRSITQNVTINPGWHVVELDLLLNSGSLAGVGVYIDGAGNQIVCSTTPDVNNTVLGATPTTGRRYRWRTLYLHTDTTPARYILGGIHSTLGSTAAAKDITVENLRIRPATAVEVETGVARSASANLNARILNEAAIAASATGAVATRTTALEVGAPANNTLPDRLGVRTNFTESLPTNSIPTTTSAYTGGTIVTQPNEGDVVQYGVATTVFWSRNALVMRSGATYRYTCRNRVVVDGTSNVMRVGYSVFDKDWALLAHVIVAQPSRTVAMGWVNDTFEVTQASIIATYSTAAYIRPFVRINTTTATVFSGSTSEVSRLRLEDITDLRVLSAAITAAESAAISGDAAVALTVTNLRASVQKKVLPTTFNDSSYFTTGGLYDNPLTVNSADPAQGSFVQVASQGVVWQTGSTAAIEGIGHKAVLPVVSGHKYRFAKKFRALTDSSNGNPLYRLMGFSVHDASGARLGDYWPAGNFTTFVAASGWLDESQIVTASEIISAYPTAAYARAGLYKWSSGGNPDGVIQVAFFEFVDVTYEENIQAQVTVSQGAIATIEGKVTAWLEATVAAGVDAVAYFRMRVANSASTVAIGADAIVLYNRVDGVDVQALKVVAGDVTVYGNLIAGKGVLLGTGAKWPVALQAKQFNLSDGVAFYYDGGSGTLDLGSTPDFDFSTTGLAALAAGESYDLSMSAANGFGATPRLKISTPGATTTYNKGPQTTNSGGTPKYQLSKGSDPDANGNLYTFSVACTCTFNVVTTMVGDLITVSLAVPIYSKKAGVWTLETYADIIGSTSYGSTGSKTFNFTGAATVTLQSAPTDFGIHNPAAVGSGSSGSWHNAADGEDYILGTLGGLGITGLTLVSWPNTAASGTRSATPSGQLCKTIVRPKNIA